MSAVIPLCLVNGAEAGIIHDYAMGHTTSQEFFAYVLRLMSSAFGALTLVWSQLSAAPRGELQLETLLRRAQSSDSALAEKREQHFLRRELRKRFVSASTARRKEEFPDVNLPSELPIQAPEAPPIEVIGAGSDSRPPAESFASLPVVAEGRGAKAFTRHSVKFEHRLLEDALPEDTTNLKRLLDEWASHLRAKRLEPLVSMYAPVLEFYEEEASPTIHRVKEKRRKLFAEAREIEITLEEPRIVYDASLSDARILFRKRYRILKGTQWLAGRALHELRWTKLGPVWKISGDRELQPIR